MDSTATSSPGLETQPPEGSNQPAPTAPVITSAVSSPDQENDDEKPKDVRLTNWFEAFDIPTIVETYHPKPCPKQQVALKKLQTTTKANIELNVAVPRWKEKSSSELVKEEGVAVYTTILVHSTHNGTENVEEWIYKGKLLLGLVDTAKKLGHHRINIVFTHRGWKEKGVLMIEGNSKERDKGKAVVVEGTSKCGSCSDRTIRVAEEQAAQQTTAQQQAPQEQAADDTLSTPHKPYNEPTGTINLNCPECLEIFSASTEITDLPQQFKSLIPVVPNDHHLGLFFDFNNWRIDDKPYLEAGKAKSSTEAASSNTPAPKRHNIILLSEGTICHWDPIEESLLQLLPGKSLDIHIVLIHSKGPFLQLKEQFKRFFAWLNDQSEMMEWWKEDWKRWDAAKKLREKRGGKKKEPQDVEAGLDAVVINTGEQGRVGDRDLTQATPPAESQSSEETQPAQETPPASQETTSGQAPSKNPITSSAQTPASPSTPEATKANYRRLPDLASLTSPWRGKNHAVNIRSTNFNNSNMNKRSEYIRILQPQRSPKYHGPVYRITKRIIMIQIFCILGVVGMWVLVQIWEWSSSGCHGERERKLVFQSPGSPGRGY
ncbi:hypothetical protein FPQ18DRAFT_329516 [Pyronema domesticum]|nr:hypothetical protein FPQ18DRAFT_329516 [Pyronema domesticum]